MSDPIVFAGVGLSYGPDGLHMLRINVSGGIRTTAARYLCRRAANWFKVSTPTENPIAA